MIYAYAIEPAVVAAMCRDKSMSWIRDHLGIGTQRMLLSLPKASKWAKLCYNELGDVSPVQKKRFEAILQHLKFGCIRRASTNYDGSKAWLANADEEYERRNYKAILAVNCKNSATSAALTWAQLDQSESERWYTDRRATPRRDISELLQFMAPMLSNSKEAHFVIPYFKASDPRKVDLLTGLCRLMAQSAAYNGDPITVYCVHEDKKDWTTFQFNSWNAKHLAPKLPQGMTVQFRRIQQKRDGARNHNRYILTDIGCVHMGDEPEGGNEGEDDDFFVVREERYRELWHRYTKANINFRLDLDQPANVIGMGQKV
jgi:hypothetical protein